MKLKYKVMTDVTNEKAGIPIALYKSKHVIISMKEISTYNRIALCVTSTNLDLLYAVIFTEDLKPLDFTSASVEIVYYER